MALVEFVLNLLWGVSPDERRAPQVLLECASGPVA